MKNIPEIVRSKFELHESKHACAILQSDFPDEWSDIMAVLSEFQLKQTWITNPGGRKSKISEFVDGFLYTRGWLERGFDTKVLIDNVAFHTPTHKVDCYKNRVALEIEWNNKDPFFDRDLNNFRLLFDLRAISVGVIITRCDELQGLFDELGRGTSFGASTTHLSKLMPRIEGGGGGGCPLLICGIKRNSFLKDSA